MADTPGASRFARWLATDDGSLRKRRFAIVLVGIYALFSGTYIPINLFSVGRHATVLYLPGEDRIPFLPIFEYLYVLTFLVPALLIVSVRTWERFVWLIRAFAIALVIAYSTYLIFPVYLERPNLEVTSLHTWLLSLQYLDKSYNHFPSLHVTLSWLAAQSAEGSGSFRTGVAVLAFGISIATVFVKQHYIVDVVFGYALAWGAWRCASARAVAASNRKMEPTGFATTSAAE